eukprot:6052319-Amphidinium_carterae.1
MSQWSIKDLHDKGVFAPNDHSWTARHTHELTFQREKLRKKCLQQALDGGLLPHERGRVAADLPGHRHHLADMKH